MRHVTTVFNLVVILACSVLLSGAFQLVNAQDPDTLDVGEGFETLNLAIENDTTAAGEPKNLNRVYRLQRGGYYLLNGSIRSVGASHLRIVAAKGEGHPPLLIPAADDQGSASRPFRPNGDLTIIGLYVTGINNLGLPAPTKNMIRPEGDGARLVVDNCFLDHEAAGFFRMNSDEQKLFLTNSVLRNATQPADPGQGRMIDTRSNLQDTIFVENCTMYMCTDEMLRTDDGIVRNLIFNHNTVHLVHAEMQIERVVNARITNNLFIDADFEGDVFDPADPADTTYNDFFPIDSLSAPEIGTDADRNIRIANNNFNYSPEILAWIDGIDTVQAAVLYNQTTLRFLETYDGMVSENNIDEEPEFTDPPDLTPVVAYAQYRLEHNFDEVDNPDVRVDRNGIKPIQEDINSFGIEDNHPDYSYPTSKQSYTHAEGGFPLGDLNWFPAKKTEWEGWVATSIENNDLSPTAPSSFALDQNYPNPFNPNTTIRYQLNEPSKVTLTIYNMVGQVVNTLVSNQAHLAGSYNVTWDGLDNSGHAVASGVYLYSLKAGNNMMSKKMLLIK
jgi:hypothetical protein